MVVAFTLNVPMKSETLTEMDRVACGIAQQIEGCIPGIETASGSAAA